MACHMCSRSSHCHQTFAEIQNSEVHHYSDVPSVAEDDEEIEPDAPTLSLGNRILWLTEARAASGIVKWIGRIPSISNSWTAGIEFDNVMPGGGNGGFRGRQYFHSRIGHAVFLPVSDLIKVDSDTPANSGERTSFFGRLQDSCSNFAHRRRRDSTFGHFKQDFCSNCERNDFANYSHYCHNAPVYDRITTRRSMCFDDHPYEMYNPCVPCGLAPNVSNHLCHNNISGRVVEDHGRPCNIDGRVPPLQPISRKTEEYPSNNYGRINMMEMRQDSFFSPRPSLSFINGFNGFKEWVTCLVLGTNKKKRKSKIIFKDKKSVNVLIAQNGQSLTGQRLSSFADYATVTVNRGRQQNAIIAETTDIKEIDDDDDDDDTKKTDSVKENAFVSNNIKEMNQAVNKPKEMNQAVNKPKEKNQAVNKPKERTNINSAEQQNIQSKVRCRKKRPAPLPPVQYQGASNNYKTNEASIRVKKESQSTLKNTKERETRYKIVRTSSFRIHATPQKHRRKKRRAPPPPLPVKTSLGPEKGVLAIPAVNSISGSTKEKDNKAAKPKFQNIAPDVNRQDISLPKSKSKKTRHKVLYQRVKHGALVNGYSDSGEESGSEDSKNSSSSLTFFEDDSDDDKYGLVKYGILNKINSSENSLNLPSTSNFIQYTGENSDVCLKISIQKTETNVVTVEEVSTPCSTTHYTIEEESSSSELSDVPVVKATEKKAITNEETKMNSADSSSVSTTEESSDKSKTIFEELQMQPPVKGSVKDFVNAFNMLANKSSTVTSESRPSSSSNLCVPKIQNTLNESDEIKNKQKDFQSFPTKWEYQNKTPSVGYPVNKFLLPIAEESHNEASEHDGNISVDESKSPSSKLKNVKNITKSTSSSKTSENVDNSSKKCSYCSESHAQTKTHGASSRSLKKRIAPRVDNVVYESARPFNKNGSSQASMAALSSLLQDKQPFSLKSDKIKGPSTEKSSEKLDQPIMVGLYIEDKSSHRGPIPLLVTPSMSLRKLKRQIEKEYEFPRHQQCWILGESFAVADEVSLASYGVTEPGCPILLYVMAKDSKSHSLPARASRLHSSPLQDASESSEEEVEKKLKGHRKNSLNLIQNMSTKVNAFKQEATLLGAIPKTEKHHSTKVPPRVSSRKRSEGKLKKSKSEFHKAWEAEFEKKADYHDLLALDDVDLVSNVENFECPVCFLDVEIGEGATLQECLHSFCKECLAGAIQFSETAVVKCPFRNDEYSCECHLQEREVKSLVTVEVYERHLQRSMALAESQAQDSFHCKTPDCPGWCLFEDNVNTFLCPVCKHTNCLTCAAIHEGKNCRQYQDDVAFRCDSSEEARKTKEYLQNMVDNGEAMRCPQCQVILMKKWGCDWLKCSMCHTEVCWVTKGPRWGPGGRGDTSGGCKCMVNGTRCHPKCSYCH